MKHLPQFVQHLIHSETGAFLQTGLYLALTAGLVALLMAVAACDCNDNGIDDCDYEKEAQYRARQVSLFRRLQEEAIPGSTANIADTSGELRAPTRRVQHLLGIETTGGTPPARVTYRWFPPDGIANLAFPARQPEPGGPPYVFRDVPPAEQIPVEFDLPAEGPYGGERLTEALAALPEGDLPTTAYLVTPLSDAAVPAPAPAVEWPREATAEMWVTDQWFTENITVSSQECQQAVDLLQGYSGFVALSLPEPPHAVTESALLPIYEYPQVKLIDYGGGLDIAGGATFRPERLAFAANSLPATDGRIWATLGVSTTPPLECPIGLETADWELYLHLTLDLSYAPDNCAGCVLDAYLCYEGQELPGGRLEHFFARRQIDRALEKMVRSATQGAAGVHSYRDWGITCAGPLPMLLRDSPDPLEWYLSGSSAQWVSPTWAITLPFVLEQDVPNPPQLIDLEYRSDLDASWTWSDGTQQIFPPISYSGGWPPQPVYLVGTVPAGTPEGLYMTYVTATLVISPTDYRLESAVVWVGDWVSPPTGPTGYRVYLPLLLRRG